MRIAIATWTGRLAGGVETYLADLMPALLQAGHHVALLHEVDEPFDRAPITTAVPRWCTSLVGAEASLLGLEAWRPDVVFAQGFDDPALDRRVTSIAPTVLFAHAYRGTCVSGTKSFAALGDRACDRRLGLPCLAHYLPKRCGGLSVVTMARLYRRESRRRDLLRHYSAVVMFSDHIQREYIRNGVAPERTHRLPCHIPVTPQRTLDGVRRSGSKPSRIVFVGRMERLKGGHVLLDALPAVQQALQRPLHATFVGDGRLRGTWEERARRVCPDPAVCSVEFAGWVDAKERTRILSEADLLVVPSLWPEPFGLIGLEAAACGVPAAAFDVGGISEWLHDGVNGHLATSDAPRAEHLAAAIRDCLRDRTTHDALSKGALEMASRHSMRKHVKALLEVFGAISPASHVDSGYPAA
jgi:glycosyltransferase involved in cell wall biosynthesis